MPHETLRDLMRFMPVEGSCYKVYGELEAFQDGYFTGFELTAIDCAEFLKELLKESAGKEITDELISIIVDKFVKRNDEVLKNIKEKREKDDQAREDYFYKEIGKEWETND